MSRAGAGEQIARALCAAFESFNVVRSYSLESRSWTSITFSGERHALRLIVQGAQADAAVHAFMAGLAEPEIFLAGHLLVDIALVGEERDADGRRVVLDLEAITVETA